MNDLAGEIEWIAIALGGVLGAVSRFGLTRAFVAYPLIEWVFRGTVSGGLARDPAWGTLVANLAACLGLGMLTAGGLDASALAFGAVGLCGSLSTFSTLCADVQRLLHEGRRLWAFLYLCAQGIGGPALLLAGRTLAL